MTSASRALSSLLVGAACVTGVAACDDTDEESDTKRGDKVVAYALPN
jgi:hypothetical protein